MPKFHCKFKKITLFLGLFVFCFSTLVAQTYRDTNFESFGPVPKDITLQSQEAQPLGQQDTLGRHSMGEVVSSIDTIVRDTALMDSMAFIQEQNEARARYFHYNPPTPQNNSILSHFMGDKNIFLPFGNYAPETSVVLGAGGVHFFKSGEKGKHTSDITYGANYSFKNQWRVFSHSNVYLEEGRWPCKMYINFNFLHFPNTFYGTGLRSSEQLTQGVDYDAYMGMIQFQPQFYINKYWLFGPILDIHVEQADWPSDIAYSSVRPIQETEDNASYQEGSDIPGFELFGEYGLGLLVSYDSRDNRYWPRKGQFMKFTFIEYSDLWGSSYAMNLTDLDTRAFIEILPHFIWANQFYMSLSNKGEKPFQMMPALGGEDKMRGIINGKWRADGVGIFQSELRMPLYYPYLSTVLFGNMAYLYDYGRGCSDALFSYGAGLRILLNKQGTNGRIDVARSQQTSSWNIYVTLAEAF